MLPYVPRPLVFKTKNEDITSICLQELVVTRRPVEESKEVNWNLDSYNHVKKKLRESSDRRKGPFVYLHGTSDYYYQELIAQNLKNNHQGYIQYILDFHENSNVLPGILLGIIQTDFIVFFINDAFFDDPLCHYALTTSLQDKKKNVIFVILTPLQQNRYDILKKILKLIKRSQKSIYRCIPNIMMMDWTEKAKLKDLMDIISSPMNEYDNCSRKDLWKHKLPMKEYDNCSRKDLWKHKLRSKIHVRRKQLDMFIRGNLEGQLFKKLNIRSEVGLHFETTLQSRAKHTSNYDINSLSALRKENTSLLQIQKCPIKFCSKKIFHPQNCFFKKTLIIPKTLTSKELGKWKPRIYLTPEQLLSEQEIDDDDDDSFRDEIVKRISRANYFFNQKEMHSSNCSQSESYFKEVLKMCCFKSEYKIEIEELIKTSSAVYCELPNIRNEVKKRKSANNNPACNYDGRLHFIQKLRQKKIFKIV